MKKKSVNLHLLFAMFLRLVRGRQEEEGYPRDLHHHFCCSLLAQLNLISPCSFSKEPTQWHLLLWNLRKCGISFTLTDSWLTLSQPCLGGAFRQTFPVTATLYVTPWSHLRWGIPPPFPFPPLQRRSPHKLLLLGDGHPQLRERQTETETRDRDRREQERRGEEREGEEEKEREPLASWDPETVSFTHTCATRLCSPYEVKIY